MALARQESPHRRHCNSGGFPDSRLAVLCSPWDKLQRVVIGRRVPPHPGPTLALSLRERESCARRMDRSSTLSLSECGERFSLSPGERVGVRGKEASPIPRSPQ